MEDFNPLWLAPFIPVFWIGGGILLSIYLRVRAGKPIRTTIPPDAVFAEGMASGHSRKNLITMVGGARGCLQVFVHGGALTIRPFFPLNLMFLPEIYDLEHVVPLTDITGARRRGFLIFSGIDVQFVTRNGDERTVRLRLAKADEFLKSIGREAV